MIEISLKAFCPWCGKEMQSMFDLTPDASKTLRSIACTDCPERQPFAHAYVELLPASRCLTCSVPLWDGWRFCVQCRREVARPS